MSVPIGRGAAGGITAQGEPLDALAATVNLEMFRPVLAKALSEKPRWAAKVPDFHMARRRFNPPLPGPTFTRPFSVSRYLLNFHLSAGARSSSNATAAFPRAGFSFPRLCTEHERVSVVWPQRPDVKRGGRPG